jgi:NAD(P)-dependent dehydrogenase (short-subunit alcohol dehydrogenase family)
MNLEGASPRDYEDLAQTVADRFGRLDGLLHNAAELGTLTPIEQYDPTLWYKVLQVNLNAPFLLTRACLPLLRRQSDASVLFTSAEVGRKGRAYWGAYGVAGFAIEGLMQILAEELGSGHTVRVNSIDPGPVRTSMRLKAFPGTDPRTLPGPETIASAYVYLMGPESRGVNGQALSAQAPE